MSDRREGLLPCRRPDGGCGAAAWLFSAVLCLLTGLAAPGCDRTPEGAPPSVVVRNGKKVILFPMGGVEVMLEVAADEASRARGLMNRKKLDRDRGMIFIYPEDRVMKFWMKDTYIPLSIAFLKADGTVVNIEKMRPLVKDPPYISRGLCRYAVEMNQGWFEEHGIREGDRIVLPREILDYPVE